MTRTKEITATIIALERVALDRWGAGDPSGCLEIFAPDVVYFDPFLEQRLGGWLAAWYAPLPGTIHNCTESTAKTGRLAPHPDALVDHAAFEELTR